MRDTLVLCYHAVSDTLPAALAVGSERFERQIELLDRMGYRGVTFLEAVRGRPDGRRVAITFDDAYRSVLERAAPALDRHGMPGTVFVPTAHIDGDNPMSWRGIDNWVNSEHGPEMEPLGWKELGELAELGWEIGSHTRTHPRLTTLGDEELRAELEGSKADVEERLGQPCRTIAYPYGDCDRRVADAARAAGYDVGGALPARWPASNDPLLYPRVGIYHGDSLLRAAIKAAPATRLARRLITRARGG